MSRTRGPEPGLLRRWRRGDRTLVMGILNVTPDSFSDGGEHDDLADALAHARRLVNGGADLIEVGGESPRPGARRPSLEEELDRVLPVVEGLVAEGIAVSIDTMRAEVAHACLERGVVVVNDVSAGLADPRMLLTVAASEADYVAMHWRGHGEVMDDLAHYDDVTGEVMAELDARVQAARAAGISDERVIIDPGFGFAKDPEHNWRLLADLSRLVEGNHRVLVGVSRKGFLGHLLATSQGPRPARLRDDATAAVTALAADQGVWAVRTHTVAQHRDAVEVAHRIHLARTGR